MMKKHFHRLCLTGFLLFVSHGLGGAQDAPPVLVCGQSVVETGWAAFSQGVGKPAIDKGDAKGLYEALRKQLADESSDWPYHLRESFFKAIDDLIAGTLALTDFKIEKDISGIQAKQYAFRHTPFQIEFPPAPGDAKCPALVAGAAFIMLVERSGVEMNKPYFKINADVINILETQYDKYLYEGFPMFPWEALAASWLLTDTSIADGPPKNQIVLLHPAAGVIGAVGSGSDTDIDAVLSVEALGWIRYTDDYASWYGASLMAVLPTDRNVGFGFALNYNHFKLGITWHDYDNDKYENPTIFFGMDLYQFVGEKYRQYTSYKDKVSNLIREKK